MTNSFSNKKELDRGFLNIDEVTDYSGIDEKDINNKQRRDHIYKKFGFDFIGKEIKKIID
ncbi:hypothetical protein [uncultured Vagococcus sp.]|uniref:hypothetical protein n=1 Tax=uncultured Vagococcus sp. TaxID=189676 RepID=UPI00258A71A5|nr:hypothetical protein [uncultured Vagococcus sp.]